MTGNYSYLRELLSERLRSLAQRSRDLSGALACLRQDGVFWLARCGGGREASFRVDIQSQFADVYSSREAQALACAKLVKSFSCGPVQCL